MILYSYEISRYQGKKGIHIQSLVQAHSQGDCSGLKTPSMANPLKKVCWHKFMKH